MQFADVDLHRMMRKLSVSASAGAKKSTRKVEETKQPIDELDSDDDPDADLKRLEPVDEEMDETVMNRLRTPDEIQLDEVGPISGSFLILFIIP